MSRPRLEVADVFPQHGAAWRRANAGHVSLGQLQVMSAIEHCRTAALGGHVERCRDCGHSRISYNSLYGDLYVKLSLGTTRGEPAHWARSIAPRPCIRLDPCWTRTMKQSFASTARLRGGGPILPTASKPWSCSGHRHLGSSLTASRESAIGRQSYAFALLDHQPRSGRRPQHNADRDFAGHDQAPQRDQQFPSECHDHRRLAHALRAFGPRPIPLRQCAVLLEP